MPHTLTQWAQWLVCVAFIYLACAIFVGAILFCLRKK